VIDTDINYHVLITEASNYEASVKCKVNVPSPTAISLSEKLESIVSMNIVEPIFERTSLIPPKRFLQTEKHQENEISVNSKTLTTLLK
jgi:hypothetical protein